MKTQSLVSISNLYKSYESAANPVHVLDNINLEIAAGERIAIVGKSGSGKTTLINLITGIDAPTSGEILIQDQSITALNQNALAQWRGKNVGIVFQFFQLLPTLTILENIILPMDLCKQFSRKQRSARALELLARVGIAEHANKLPAALSGGQQQRAAIARALANNPPLIVADEPTGNLDSVTSNEILTLFGELAREGKTLIAVSHERDISQHVDRVIHLKDGAIVGVTP
ncbi:ABC transporter ATP-binding protein [Cellvibrio sp.]|uniref:ABC transporter ATP-binding protein n=1 Tax=Cellvibrio sp. TaxID=1965322 RepID=UPI0039648554